jgi:hypothetical protein
MSINLGPVAGVLYKIAAPNPNDFRGIWVPCSTDDDPSTANDRPKRFNGSAWVYVAADGTNGVDGDSFYIYQAYAQSNAGVGFTTTFQSDPGIYPYWAFLVTTAPIASPQASDFAGLWVARAANGISWYPYTAYANDTSGTAFVCNVFANPDSYSHSATIWLTVSEPWANRVVGDFAGQWYRHKGATGAQGVAGKHITAVAWNGNDIQFTFNDATTVSLVGAKTTLKGDPGAGIESYLKSFATTLKFDYSKHADTAQTGVIAFALDPTDLVPGVIWTLLISQNGTDPITFPPEFKEIGAPNNVMNDICAIECRAIDTNTILTYINNYTP